MKLAFAIQRKIRVALVLAVLMLFIIIFSLLESNNITKISRSFDSIYQDRLVPAVDLFSIADHLHNKQNHLFTYLFTENISSEEIRRHIDSENAALDKLISKYEGTYLVRNEMSYLANLKKNILDYRRDEQLLMKAAATSKETARELYMNTTLHLYSELTKDLMRLTQVQTEVGRQLMKDTMERRTSSGLISTLQLIIAIILGVVIMILILTDKQVLLRQEKYNMN